MSKQSNEFEIFYNALSVGWHLRKIKEIFPQLLNNPKDYGRLLLWLERHKLSHKNGRLHDKK